MKKTTLFLAMVAGAAVACQKPDEEPVVTPELERIPINISMDVWTKVTDTDFESGDKAGIYVVNYDGATAGTLAVSGNHVDNNAYNYTTGWAPEKEIYWKDQTTKADFYCYIPYAEPTSVTAHPFAVKADQSVLANYKASEFLWGKATGISPTEAAVPIITNRSMSNMIIYVKPGKGFTEESLAAAVKSVKICNVKTEATVNLATGVAAATGSAGEMVPYNEGEYYRALMVPQTVADGSNLVVVTVDGVNYTFAKGFTFRANTQHKFTITVNKVGNGVDIGVGNWDVDGEDHGGAAE